MEAMAREDLEKAREELISIKNNLINLFDKTPNGTDLGRSLSKAIDRISDAINDIYIELKE
jgi:hypothetical protein